MALLDVPIPQVTSKINMFDAVDPTDRSIETVFGQAQMIQQFLRKIQNYSPSTGLVGTGAYFMPSRIAASNRATYETAIDNSVAAATTLITNITAIMDLG